MVKSDDGEFSFTALKNNDQITFSLSFGIFGTVLPFGNKECIL